MRNPALRADRFFLTGVDNRQDRLARRTQLKYAKRNDGTKKGPVVPPPWYRCRIEPSASGLQQRSAFKNLRNLARQFGRSLKGAA